MKLILPDRTERVIESGPVPLDRLLLAEGINPGEVIASRDGTLIPEDAVVGPGDEVRLIRIAHGG
jgi:sulfur carrier protein ThiS